MWHLAMTSMSALFCDIDHACSWEGRISRFAKASHVLTICPASSELKYMPRGLLYSLWKLRHAQPTVGSYTIEAISAKFSRRMR